jgi:hypothetical protein
MAENNPELHAKLQELDHELAVRVPFPFLVECMLMTEGDYRMATLLTKGTSGSNTMAPIFDI